MSESRMVAIVSGSGSGIGAGIATCLAEDGYHVIVNHLRETEEAASTVKKIVEAGGSAQRFQADVRDEEQVARMVEQVCAEHGWIDVLVCNANTASPTFEPVTTLPWSVFHHKLTSELSGVYFLTQHVLATMTARRAGRIVYISSTAADTSAGSAEHATAKAALNTYSRHVASEAALYGITVNTVAPGFVMTDASAPVAPEELRSYLSRRSLFGRMLTPLDIGRAVAQLVDPRSAAVTGQVITVDGGLDGLTQRRSGLTPLPLPSADVETVS